MVPPCCSTIACTSGRPSPEPPSLVVKNGSKMRAAQLVAECPGRCPRSRARTSRVDDGGAHAHRAARRRRLDARSAPGSSPPAAAARSSPATGGSAVEAALEPHARAARACAREQVDHARRAARRARRGSGASSRGRANCRNSSSTRLSRSISSCTSSSGSSSVGCIGRAAVCSAPLEHRELQRGGVERVLDLVREAGGERADGGELLGHAARAARARASPRAARTCRSACSTASSSSGVAHGLIR